MATSRMVRVNELLKREIAEDLHRNFSGTISTPTHRHRANVYPICAMPSDSIFGRSRPTRYDPHLPPSARNCRDIKQKPNTRPNSVISMNLSRMAIISSPFSVSSNENKTIPKNEPP